MFWPEFPDARLLLTIQSRTGIRQLWNIQSRSSFGHFLEGNNMTTELFWLTATVLMTALMWMPYILNRIAVRGLIGALANETPQS